ncbi:MULTISPECIES: hypothetical protein [Streptomyces]|jgi:hypothetical protein|nr:MULTISPECIES: hypothetical protein [unclassified Streptomyces]
MRQELLEGNWRITALLIAAEAVFPANRFTERSIWLLEFTMNHPI